MKACHVAGALAAALAMFLPSDSLEASQSGRTTTGAEGRIPGGKASLYFRQIGRGRPIIVLHGGPDFDSGYLLPDLDRLANKYRLIYYDQRGFRGSMVYSSK